MEAAQQRIGVAVPSETIRSIFCTASLHSEQCGSEPVVDVRKALGAPSLYALLESSARIVAGGAMEQRITSEHEQLLAEQRLRRMKSRGVAALETEVMAHPNVLSTASVSSNRRRK